jgi:S-adenosylmethionine:tRNA ribosyltransferase-isomerase
MKRMTRLDLFDFDLPERLIAQRPADRREDSRLMKVDRRTGSIFHHPSFRSFPDLLHSGDVLVINQTRVIPARLPGRRTTGGAVELLLVRPEGNGVWIAMVRGMKKLKPTESILIGDGECRFVETVGEGLARITFASQADSIRLMTMFGDTPLPPYILRPGGKADDADRERYQTLFAKTPGSCAAPTAGLHFSQSILDALEQKGIGIAPVELHVGPGTFRPVKSETIEEHWMDEEPYHIPDSTAALIDATKQRGGRVVAVGSTVTRTLESAATEEGRVAAGAGATSLYVIPGYRFKVVDALLTNFHLPKSTLLILISAFMRRDHALAAYGEAIDQEYRFFSYGDAMFIG